MPPRFIIQDQGTIRETRDDSPTRPRKRQRTDSAIDTGGYSDSDCLVSVGPVVDDPEFYRHEAAADCVVRVGSTRFKVKGSLLSEASPVLQDILARHLEATRRPDAALVIIADADEFRALLWALYASPEEIAAQPRDHADLDRLLLIAAISRQYRCAALESWASSALLRTITTNAPFTASLPSTSFKALIDTAVRTHNDALLQSTIAAWSARLRAGSAPCVPAILTADAHELDGLRGVAYYHHIQAMLAGQEGTGVTQRGAIAQMHADTKLSNAQVMRLLAGHWSLVSLWERLRRAPPAFECECAGGGEKNRRCVKAFAAAWDAAAASKRITAMSSASVLALLATMREVLAADAELSNNMPTGCRVKALEAVKVQAGVFEDGLADHFFGWL